MDKVDEVLTRGVAEIIDREHLEKRLRNGEKLRIKHGIDPTGPKIHIGRASQFLKLREFQKMGHHIILIMGTFTARIGDASDKESMRPMLSEKQIKKNLKTYRKQIGKILNLKKTEIRENAEWLSKLGPQEIIKLTSRFTYAQIIERDLFQKRISEKKDLGLHELLYPLMQGYDSVAVKADLELGGTDQKFNLLFGRNVQRLYKQKPQDIMTLKMVLGTDGRKMSTSWRNVINIVDHASEMFGKIMSMKDDLIIQYFELLTLVPLQIIKAHQKALASRRVNPMDLKKQLGFEIVKMYHGEKAAQEAQREFERVFQKRELPSKIQTKKMVPGKEGKGYRLFEIVFYSGSSLSKADAKRVIEQGGVQIDSKTIRDPQFRPKSNKGDSLILKIGKLKYKKIEFEE